MLIDPNPQVPTAMSLGDRDTSARIRATLSSPVRPESSLSVEEYGPGSTSPRATLV
jgi:hypothetical protein